MNVYNIDLECCGNCKHFEDDNSYDYGWNCKVHSSCGILDYNTVCSNWQYDNKKFNDRNIDEELQ